MVQLYICFMVIIYCNVSNTVETTCTTSHSMGEPVCTVWYIIQVTRYIMHIYIYHRSIVDGFSTRDLKEASHCAPTAPSTTLWSQLRVTVIMLATRYLGGGEGRERGTVNNISPKFNTLTSKLKKPTPLHFLHPRSASFHWFPLPGCKTARERDRERRYGTSAKNNNKKKN